MRSMGRLDEVQCCNFEECWCDEEVRSDCGWVVFFWGVSDISKLTYLNINR